MNSRQCLMFFESADIIQAVPALNNYFVNISTSILWMFNIASSLIIACNHDVCILLCALVNHRTEVCILRSCHFMLIKHGGSSFRKFDDILIFQKFSFYLLCIDLVLCRVHYPWNSPAWLSQVCPGKEIKHSALTISTSQSQIASVKQKWK